MSERKLVTVEVISDIQPIEGADAIEVATVRGWKVVVSKSLNHEVGDKVVYCEIDSFLPITDPRFADLAPRGTKTVEVNGESVTGHVLRTAKLRGQVSQGLIIPLEECPEIVNPTVGEDYSEALGIFKYEPPIPANLAGQIVGKFPTKFVRKSDSERVQNLTAVFDDLRQDEWYATEKIDGSSVTIINDGEKIRYCSRNWELTPNEDLASVKVAQRLGLTECLEPGMAIQAEIAGPGIQGNGLGLPDVTLFVYGVYYNGNSVIRDNWPKPCLDHAVPALDLELPESVSEAVSQVSGMKSSVSPKRLAEGVVWHSQTGKTYEALDGRSNFKVISDKWLLKNGG